MSVTMEECAETEENPSSLLRLPRELRDRVFENALESNNKIWLMPNDKPPGIVTACRQTREEARSIYYESNTFYIAPERCVPWLRSLEDQDRMRVRQIRLLKPMPPPMATKFGCKARMLLERIPVLRDIRCQLERVQLNPSLRIEISIRLSNLDHIAWVGLKAPRRKAFVNDWFVEAVAEHPAIGMYISHFFEDTSREGRRSGRIRWH